jgi:hypothetical protein
LKLFNESTMIARDEVERLFPTLTRLDRDAVTRTQNRRYALKLVSMGKDILDDSGSTAAAAACAEKDDAVTRIERAMDQFDAALEMDDTCSEAYLAKGSL